MDKAHHYRNKRLNFITGTIVVTLIIAIIIYYLIKPNNLLDIENYVDEDFYADYRNNEVIQQAPAVHGVKAKPWIAAYEDKNLIIEVSNFPTSHNYIYELVDKLEGICTTQDPQYTILYDVLYLIYTKEENFAGRNIIRNTWASETKFVNKVRRIFFTFHKNDSLIAQITEELREHKDLLIPNFATTLHINDTDNFRSLFVMMAIQWSVDYCNNFKYVIITNDNAFVNTPFILNNLNYQNQNKYSFLYKDKVTSTRDVCGAIPGLVEERIMAGNLIENEKVLRTGENGLSLNDFPLNVHINYIKTSFMIFSGNVLSSLVFASFNTKYKPQYGDAYIGYLAEWAQVKPEKLIGIINDNYKTIKSINNIFVINNLPNEKVIQDLWDKYTVK